MKKHYLALIYQKSISDLKAEARRGTLGILWWIVEPVLYMAVFYVIFYLVFNRGDEGAVYSLLTGLVAWKWFDSSVRQSASCISASVGLIRQVYIPKAVLPAMVVFTNTFKFLIILVILMLFLSFTKGSVSFAWLSLFPVMLVQLLTILAIGGLFAALVPFIPDFRILIDNGMTMMFFLSGIFFDIGATSEKIQNILYLNPMVGIIESYRVVLLDGGWPNWILLSKVTLFSLTVLALAGYLLKKYDREYLKVI